MITFLLEEGVLTVGALSGIFTTGLLTSLKNNIIIPSVEKLVPSHTLDTKENLSDTEKSGILNELKPSHTTIVKWQTFLKDIIEWVIIMFLIYLFWKKILEPHKTKTV